MSGPSSTSANFFLIVSNEKAGPFTYSATVKMIEQQLVSTATLAWCEGMANWQALSSIEAFKTSFEEAGTKPQPPPVPLHQSLSVNVATAPFQTQAPTLQSAGGPETGFQSAPHSPELPNESYAKAAVGVCFAIAILSAVAPSSIALLSWVMVLATACLIYADARALKAGSENDLNKKGKKREGPGVWLAGSLFIWIAAFPMWMKRRSDYGAKNMLGLSLLSILAVFAGFCVGIGHPQGLSTRTPSSIFEAPEVTMVKGGSMNACPSKTIDQLVSNFFESPKWDSGVSSTGLKFVNIEGGMTYMDKPVKGLVQFTIQGDSFKFRAFELNGIPQNGFLQMALINKLCGN